VKWADMCNVKASPISVAMSFSCGANHYDE